MTQETERQLYITPDGQNRWLTADEALSEGFCPLCGSFVAGSEWDDLSIGRYGACAECLDEIESEATLDDDFDD